MNYAYQALRGHWQRWLAAMLVLLGLVAIPARAEAEPTASDPNYYAPLKPSDLIYQLDGTTATNPDDTAITLHKQAVRTGPTEWTVDVSATVLNTQVEPPKLEVVFLLDASTSMRDNNAHTHTNKCEPNCSIIEGHEHWYDGTDKDCYSDTPHWNSWGHNHNTAGCVQVYNQWYALECTIEENHKHKTTDCDTLKCSEGHTHTLGCYECPFYAKTDQYLDENEATRMAVAVAAAEKLISELPKGTDVTRLAFNSGFYTIDEDKTYLDQSNSRNTAMWTAINRALATESNGDYTYFSTAQTQKIFVLLSDGEATDNKDDNKQNAYDKLNEFKATPINGIVYTVGFGDTDGKYLEDLEEIATDTDHFMVAENAEKLVEAFDKISNEISAMIEDPMGNVVGFDKVGFQDNVQSNIGEVTFVGDTIYWNPTKEDATISQIRYSYEVTLDAETDSNASFHTVGTHSQVPLNNPTFFHYSVDADLRDVNFPIPQATYAISSLQTTWRTTDNIILAATNNTETVIAPTTACAPEKIVGCDFKNEDGSWYFTDFTQDYAIKDSFTDNGATYLYVRTEITINGGEPIVVQTAKALEELVKAYEPNAYQVVHLYEKNMPLKLTVSKIVSGNMGSRNSKFDFTVTLPDMAGQTVGCTLGNTPTTLTLDVQGKASFSLSHDQTLVMNNVHGNYQVEEAPYGSYVTTVSVNDGQAEQKNSVMGKLDASNTHVAYTNSLDATIPTGVFTSSASALAGLLLSVVMFTITRAGRRARDDE